MDNFNKSEVDFKPTPKFWSAFTALVLAVIEFIKTFSDKENK